MTQRKHYTDAERDYFVSVAEHKGIARARQELGMPADARTARNWVQQAGVTPLSGSRDYIATAARRLDRPEIIKAWMVKAETYLERDLSAAEFAKMAEAVNKLMQTLQLVLGDVTSRTEQVKHEVTEFDKQVDELLSQFEQAQQNELTEAPKSQNDTLSIGTGGRSDATSANRGPKGEL